MNKFGISILFLLFSTLEVRAEEAVIIEVRKNIGMSKADKIYKNYFINGGENLGLKKGTMVDVLRRVPVHDPLKNASIGDIRVKVGQIEIIHADAKISVAKLVSNDSPETRPLLEYEAVMVGDRLDLESVQSGKTIELSPSTASSWEPEMETMQVALFQRESKAQKLVKAGERSLASLEHKVARGLASVKKDKKKKSAVPQAKPAKKKLAYAQ